ncbi:MAG: hypothetical protein ABIN95_08185 [Mucilaginibacter sp.]
MVAIITYGCNSFSVNDYKGLVKRELKKGKRVDSLFLGISFGMTSKTFYGHCWELNKKGILSDGASNTMVLYKIDSALKYPATMNFYPDFLANKIYHMRVTFAYDAWAPWNKALYADSLVTDVLRLYKNWYPGGNEFMKMTDKKRGIIYVKVDGNRRIILGGYSDNEVRADYTDLLVENQLKK